MKYLFPLEIKEKLQTLILVEEGFKPVKSLIFTTNVICLKFIFQMADPDPETLLEWLSSGLGDERDMQLIALEQLCMLLLMSDNVDRCFER